MAHGGSMWSLRGPQSQDANPENRHSAWRFKGRDKTQRKGLSSTPPKNAILTISWHHTHRLPANVLIFLWQTWHLQELLSVRIQSWAATWGRKDGDEKVCSLQPSGLLTPAVTYTASSRLEYFSTVLFSFSNKQSPKGHHMMRPHCQFILHTWSHWHIYYAKDAERMWAVSCGVVRTWVTNVHKCAKLGHLADVLSRVCRL